MEEKELECIEMIIHPDTEAFLKREKENQDNNLQKLKQEKQSIENFFESIGSEERAEAKLNKITADVIIKEREYNTAKSNAEQAVKSYEAGLQSGEAVMIKKQLSMLETYISYYTCECGSKRTLQAKKNEQEKRLEKIKKELDIRYDKANKEQVKAKAETELKKHIELKNQAEKDLKIIKENQVKIEVSDAKMKLAQEESVKVQDMLRELSKQAYEIENDVDLDVKTYEEGPNDELKRNILDSPIVNEDTLEQQYEL